MKKTRIALVFDVLTSLTAGSAVSTIRFAELLKERGHHVIFISAKKRTDHKIDFFHGIKIYRFPSLTFPKTEKKVLFAFPTVRKIKRILLKEKIEIVHLMIPTYAALVSALAAKSLGLKLVAHSHTQPENLFLHWGKKLEFRALNNVFYRYLVCFYNQAQITICPTQFSALLLKKRSSKMKTIVISNGVNLAKFKVMDTLPFFKKYRLSPKNQHLLFVGRLHPEKSIETLIAAAPLILKQHPSTHLLIVGEGNVKSKLEKLINRLGLKSHVHLLGKISDQDLVLAYNACDIFVLPSLAELEGMVVLEAMACRKPILIANSQHSAAKYFVDQNGFLFASGNHKDLAGKAVQILKDQNLREQMASKSYQQIKNYDINQSVSKIEKVYASLK